MVCFAVGGDIVIDPTVKNYFVKTESSGTGDGKTWDDAMSGEMFAQYLPLVGNGVTFHLAKGDYMPPSSDDLISNAEDANLEGRNFDISYSVNTVVSIIGGYPENPDENSTPDYKKNVTRFVWNSLSTHQHFFELSPNSQLKLSHVYLDGNNLVICSPFYIRDASLSVENAVISSFNAGITNAATCVGAWLQEDCDVSFENVLFKNNLSSQGQRAGIIYYDVNATESVSFRNCSFENNSSTISSSSLLSLHGKNNSCSFENCTFYKNSNPEGFVLFSDGGYLEMVNSTFYGNTAKSSDLLYSSSGCQSSFSYNTIIQDVDSENELIFLGGNSNMSLFNNIILNWSNGAFYSTDAIAELSSSQNLVFNRSSETDILIGTEISDILDGGAVGGVWTPNLDYHGGLTKSVALKTDALKDGTSIRVTKARKDPGMDQRGYPRMKSTCVGAYEICEPISVNVVDEISVGEEFLNKKYTQIGLYSGLEEVLVSFYGCDSVVNHTLLVKPDPSVVEYYVKENGSGAGSSWDDALSPKMFNYVLKNLQVDNVTFYVAGGTYKPYYDSYSMESTSRNRNWSTNHPVTIIGGFSPKSTGKVKSTDVPDVKAFPTYLSGDIDGDDKIVEGGCSFTVENKGDDILSSLLHIDMTENEGMSKISNLILKGVYGDNRNYPKAINIWGKQYSQSRFEMTSCIVTMCDEALSTTNIDYLTIDHSEFSYVTGGAVNSDASTSINASTFNYCGSAINLRSNIGSNEIVNSTFVNNGSDFNLTGNDELGRSSDKMCNNTFVSCDGSGTSTISGAKPLYLYGNIFAGSQLSVLNDRAGIMRISDNVFVTPIIGHSIGDDNIMTDRQTLFGGTMDGTYSSSSDVFSAKLSEEQGSTPFIALLKDDLTDGTSIRFDKLADLDIDQRGKERLLKTCMGSYELQCPDDVKEEAKTIYVGELFNDVIYKTVGVYVVDVYSMNDNGCESVTKYTLTVLPKVSSFGGYYVKTQSSGSGDGSRWEDAMNGEDFARYLPLVPDGTTFYVAQGRYSPIMDKNFETVDNLQYTVNSSVSIIGGYSPDAETGAVPDPIQYQTVFTGDPLGDDEWADDIYKETYSRLNDPSGDDLKVTTLFSADKSKDISFFGCVFSGVSSSVKVEGGSFSLSSPLECGNVKLSYCTFEKCGTIWSSSNYKLTADNCIFRNRTSVASPSSIFKQGEIYVDKSLFENMAGSSGGNFGGVSRIVKVQNSIFNNMRNTNDVFESAKEVYLYNNLFVNMSSIAGFNYLFKVTDKAEIVGNIVKGCKYKYLVTPSENSVVKHNLCENIIGTDGDIVSEDFSDYVVDGVYDSEADIFTPTLTDWGGYVPTVVTKSDKLPDGTSIRFPLVETIVETDQRGVDRLSSTCMGVYEIPCDEDVVEVSETIFVGEEFHGKVYSSVGRFIVTETEKNDLGCESVVKYTLTVKPKGLNYYVKMHGTGDGSSWKNAMNGDDFANQLPIVPDGATFYVAEGEYMPKYGRDFSTTENSAERCYEVNSKVTIIGGYPDYAENDEKSEPDKFETIINGDALNDNEEDYNGSYGGKLNFKNYEDNVKVLFAQKADLNLYGVKIKGCYDPNTNPRGPIVMEKDNLKLSLRLVDFIGNTTCVQGSDNSEIYVDSCRFEKNVACGSKAGAIVNNGTLVVKNSVFRQCNTCNYGGAIVCNSGAIVDIENSTFDNCYAYNGAAVSLQQKCQMRSVNSTYVNNFSEVAVIYGVYTDCELYNNTIFSNEVDAKHTVYFGGNASLKMEGNVIDNIEVSGYSGPVSSKNNIFMCDLSSRGSASSWTGESGAIEVSDMDCSTCFDGVYDALNGRFKANLRMNGGFTPTVAVIKDKLPDATSIRFPQIIGIDKDERGVERLDQTCIGAYEYDDIDWKEMCEDPVLLFREDFGKGDPDTDYSSEQLPDGITTLIFQPNFPLATNSGNYHSDIMGCYDIRKNGYHRINSNGTPFTSWYIDFDDHTSPDNLHEGNLMQIDMSSGPAVFYTLKMDKLCENTHLILSMWGHPVNKGVDTELKLSVEDLQGNPLMEQPVDVSIDARKNEWQQFLLYFTVPGGVNTAMFKIYSEGGHTGNDFAIDDIEVYLCKPSAKVTAPDGVLCEGGSYSLSATYDKADLGGYIAPVEYTWFKNEGDPNDIDSWEKVSTGSDLSFSSFSSKDNGYYRCVISSNGVEAEINNCNSMSDPIEMRIYQPQVEERFVTLFPGEEFNGVSYYQPGTYDLSEKIENEYGCSDLLITHIVVTELRSEYYVKTERHLKGDGSDWDNAMNGYDFAQVLPHVKDGTTFYIADGTYHPYFNSNGVESTGVDRHYVAKAAINIVGGYSPEATGDASTTTPDPFTYHTVLSGDFKDDDVWTVDGCGMVHDENVDVDNLKGESLMLVDMSKRGGKSTFKNVEFTGMRSGNGSPSLLTVHGYNGVGSVESNGLEVYRCTFSQAYSGISSSKVSDVNVSQCEISKLLFSGISVNYADKSILVDRTTLSYCGGYGLVFNDNKAEIKVRNSTLVNNRTDYSNTRNTGSINVFNNTFLSCQGAQDVLVGSSMNYNFVGNIFASGAMNPVVDGDENGNVTSICNIYVGFTPTFKGEKDVLASRAALPSFLEGQASATSFVPTLKRNDGGFTTTVAVTSPSFVNGAEMSTIRFAMSNMLEKIKIDETGKVRLYNTCMGAYEYIGNLCDDPYYSITFTSNPVTKESHSVDLVVPYDEVPTLMLMDTEGEVISKGWYNWYSISAVEENKYKIEFNMATLRPKKLDPLTPFVLIVKQGDKYVKIAYMYVSRI